MTAGVEISLFMGYLHGVDTGLRGPASIGHMVFFGPVRPLGIYIFYIYLGSEVGLWVMTAGVEILLFMGLLGCSIIVLRGLTYFGDTRPVGRGHSQKFFLYIFLYISYIFGVETTLVSDDCGGGDIAIYHVYACWYN